MGPLNFWVGPVTIIVTLHVILYCTYSCHLLTFFKMCVSPVSFPVWSVWFCNFQIQEPREMITSLNMGQWTFYDVIVSSFSLNHRGCMSYMLYLYLHTVCNNIFSILHVGSGSLLVIHKTIVKMEHWIISDFGDIFDRLWWQSFGIYIQIQYLLLY